MLSISANVLPLINKTSHHTTEPPDSNGVCNVATGLWSTGKMFYAVTSHVTPSSNRMDVFGFGECQMNVSYPSASFQLSSSVAELWCGRVFRGIFF